MALDNPVDAWLQVAQAKERNRRQVMQDIQGFGQGLGGTLSGLAAQAQQRRQQGQYQKTINEMLFNPLIPPEKREMLRMVAPFVNQQTAGSLLPSFMKMKTQANPGIPSPAGYVDTQGNLSPTPQPGYQPVTKQQLPYMAVSKSAKSRDEAMKSRSEAWQRSIDTRQIDELTRRIGLTQKMQSTLQNNTMRALRSYIPILSRPRITYQELALGETDLAAIMQGGVPHVDQVHNTHFPGWQEWWGRIKTYATGHPAEVVPKDVQDKVRQMVGDVVKIDNTFLQANKKFSTSMLGPTIRGGISPKQTQAINEMTGVMTPPLGESSDFSSMSDDELRRIAAGGQ